MKLVNSTTDMLGFKLELPQREDGITKKTRPIYLDMQVILQLYRLRVTTFL